ncbi:MYND-type domain-containing protein [Mycena indigotica]|uniref:MYND-type domain-containing protein n=1 Tax=Mycena indigotica TaxID=2126181 RepID=A0A8H6W0A0_9AGAR|nr:MYND-type domain-containing protein [Mycena indigotica]KAF7296853.1 MYND-type domain-containing protein [Mycena indigotica]
MHPSLALSNLNKLPFRHKKLATEAVEGNLQKLDALLEALKTLPQKQHAFVTPVLYALLEPDSAIIQELLEQGVAGAERLARRLTQLQTTFSLAPTVLLSSPIPEDAATAVWERIWFWAQFLDQLYEQLPLMPREEVYISFILASLPLTSHVDKSRAAFPLQTPGVRAMLARAWVTLFRDKSLRSLQMISFGLNYLTQDAYEDDEETCLWELSDQLGGLDALADLIIEHLAHLFPAPAPATPQTVKLADGLVYFLHRIWHSTSFISMLPDAGICSLLVTVCRALSADQSSLAQNLYELVHELLIDGLCSHAFTEKGARSIADSLSAGLLSLLTPPTPYKTRKELLLVFDRVLPGKTVFPSVLVSLSPVLPTLEPPSDIIIGGAFLKVWNHFVELVERRSAFFVHSCRNTIAPLRACHNLKCNQIRKKTEFKQCTGCLVAYYCSKACQREDYRTGAHRHECPKLNEARKGERLSLKKEDDKFFRALLAAEYARRKVEIGVKIVKFWTENPDEVPCLEFDFSAGAVTVNVYSAPYMNSVTHMGEIKRGYRWPPDGFSEAVARSAASQGRVWVHLFAVEVGDGGASNVRLLLKPLHTENAALWNGLKIIAARWRCDNSINIADEPQREDVERLVKVCEGIAETHS